MDSVYRTLHRDGVGAQKHQTEEKNSGTLKSGVSTPQTLLRAVFFGNGKMFCLRGGAEHRELKLSQIQKTETGYQYTESALKNRSGGLAKANLKNRVVQI